MTIHVARIFQNSERVSDMLKNHLGRHGLSYAEHFRNNLHYTILALKAAFYTFGHGLTPRISGQRASELHNQLWREGREASINDLNHRLLNNMYADKQEALADYQLYSILYDEEPVMTNYAREIESHYLCKSREQLAN